MCSRSLISTYLFATGLLLVLLCSEQSVAQQLIEARDGVAVEAVLSRQEPTRIRIEGAPITDVFGSIYSSTCTPPSPELLMPGAADTRALALNPAGELTLECDRSKGEIYVKPVGDSDKPVNLFVASAQATYTLILRPADTPADTVVIRDSAPWVLNPKTALAAGNAPAQVRAIKRLLSAMATDRVPAGYQIEELNQPQALWQEARLTLLRRYEGQTLIGERYQLLNISAQELVLAEQEFDRPGSEVLGVAIDQHNLLPGAGSAVYVIRRAQEQP